MHEQQSDRDLHAKAAQVCCAQCLSYRVGASPLLLCVQTVCKMKGGPQQKHRPWRGQHWGSSQTLHRTASLQARSGLASQSSPCLAVALGSHLQGSACIAISHPAALATRSSPSRLIIMQGGDFHCENQQRFSNGKSHCVKDDRPGGSSN